jgi:uncharacterized protein
MKIVALALASLVFCGGSVSVQAASFDCAKAKGKIEKAICADQSLSNLDEYLGRYYSGASEALKDGAACLKTDQRAWVKTVRDACGTKTACLKDAYLKRLGTLDNLQPGVSQLKNIDLPRVPALVTTLPPAVDSLPAKPGKVMKVAGKLVYEIDDIYNQGYGVKPAGGKSAAFIFDMDFGSSPTHEIVKELTEQGGNARYEVRGYLSLEGGFDAGQCRYIYAMP